MTDQIVLRISCEQAEAVAATFDAFSRLGIGQVRIVAEMIRDGDIPFAKDFEHDDQLTRMRIIDDLMTSVAKNLGFEGAGHSLGIGNRRVGDATHRVYEVMKVLKQTLALHRNPVPGLRGVDYDGLRLRYTTDPAPVAYVETSSHETAQPLDKSRFTKGDAVTWRSSAGGVAKTKTGEVVEIVPVGQVPKTRGDGWGSPRFDRESYVVAVPNPKKGRKFYWPRVSQLRIAQR